MSGRKIGCISGPNLSIIRYRQTAPKLGWAPDGSSVTPRCTPRKCPADGAQVPGASGAKVRAREKLGTDKSLDLRTLRHMP